MKYVLEMSEEQAVAISEACEVAARIGMYQLHDICRLLPQSSEEDRKKHQEIYDLMWEKYLYYTHGMHGYKKPEQTNVLWDLHQVIRHKISWDRSPAGGNTVNFHNPLKTSISELASIKRID